MKNFNNAGHTQSRLDQAVRKLAQFAAEKGMVTNVINAAGVSPGMADAESLIRMNTLGTVHVNRELSKIMEEGSVLLDVSSSSAYEVPAFLRSRKTMELAENNEEAFVRRIVRFSNLFHGYYRMHMHSVNSLCANMSKNVCCVMVAVHPDIKEKICLYHPFAKTVDKKHPTYKI